MDSFESSTNSFVVKIWLEDIEEIKETPLWRGHITHVPSKKRQHIKDLDGITNFITLYLKEMGVEGEEISQGVRGWLRRRSV